MSVCTQSTQFTSPVIRVSETQGWLTTEEQAANYTAHHPVIQPSNMEKMWSKPQNTLGLSFLDGKVQLKVGWIRAWNIWCDDDRQNYALFRPNKSSHLENSSKKSCFMISWKGFFQSNWCMEQEHLEPLKVVIVLNRLAFYLNFPHALLY